jgi:leucyl-tRNA---protein transferase
MILYPDSYLFDDENKLEINNQVIHHQHAWLMSIGDEELDLMFENGWRRAGNIFYRYSYDTHDDIATGGPKKVLPLRIPVNAFTLTKSQSKIWRKNAEFTWNLVSGRPTEAHHELFLLHRDRFERNAPDSIYDFITTTHESLPTRGLLLDVYDGDALIASSLIDHTSKSLSSIYAMFHPAYRAFSLGVHTMLLEIYAAKQLGITFYYPGFAHHESSFYDYKKRFNALQWLDWKDAVDWLPYERLREKTEKE